MVNDSNDVIVYLSPIEKILLWIKQLARDTKKTHQFNHVD